MKIDVRTLPEKLKDVSFSIFKELRQTPSEYGFHFSYSRESAWNGNADFLILTANPSANDGKKTPRTVIPIEPWPEVNDFFDPVSRMPSKSAVQSICYELARISDGDGGNGFAPLDAARNFADSGAILASFVPFRAMNARGIEGWMREFAKKEYWGRIFDVWQPRAVIALGNEPFLGMRDLMRGRYQFMEEFEEKTAPGSLLSYRLERYCMPAGKSISLVGLPHPVAHGKKGFPTQFPKKATAGSPCREFLEKAFLKENTNGVLGRAVLVAFLSLGSLQAGGSVAAAEQGAFIQGVKNTLSGISATARSLLPGNVAVGNPTTQDSDDAFFREVWKDFSDVSNDAIEFAASDNPRERSALEFVTMREPKYVRLLKEGRQILGRSEISRQFEEIDSLREENSRLNEKITALKARRVSAPESSLNPLTETKKSIDKKLQTLPSEIEANRNRIHSLKAEIIATLGKGGVEISSDELDYFIVSAEGSDLMMLLNVAGNMKKLQRAIGRELRDNSGNVELARLYAGMYLVSLDAYANAHDLALKNIEGYRSRLGNIRNEAKSNRDEALRLTKSASGQDLANVEANARISGRTIEIADMYEGLLKKRATSLEASREAIEAKARIARNTYRTIANGSSLISLVNDGSDEYMLLMGFEIPELKNIYDDAMMTAFAEISERIRKEK